MTSTLPDDSADAPSAAPPDPVRPAAAGPSVTTTDVWKQLEQCSFAVISHVTPSGDPRSSGVLYKAVGRRLYVGTGADSWKARHLAERGRVAVTVPVRRGGLLALVAPIPPATICFHGAATVHPPGTMEIPDDLAALIPPEARADSAIIEIEPEGAFLTYGIGIPLLKMRDTEASRAHTPVS